GRALRLHPPPAGTTVRSRKRRGAGASRGERRGHAAGDRPTGWRGSDRTISGGRSRWGGRRSHARSVEFSGRARRPPAKSRARRRGIAAGARLLDPARLRPQPSVRRRDQTRRGRAPVRARGGRLRRAARTHHGDRMPDDQPVSWHDHGAAALHARLWSELRSLRAQGHGHGVGRPGVAGTRAGRGGQGSGAGRGIRAVAFRQRAGDRIRRAPEAAALRRFSVGARPRSPPASGIRAGRRGWPRSGGSGMNAPRYNFAYLDEQTKRMIRRAILKAVAIPGYQVPFASREMPMPYGWGTGGVQVTASILGPDDVLKVIDQGSDDTTNAVSIRKFFMKTAGVRTTTSTRKATVIQTRHRIPEAPLGEHQILVLQVPIPEPLRFLEPRETETRRMHALAEYGLMHVKLYEDIARHGHIATTYAYPVKVDGRYVTDPSPTPKFDNPKMNDCAALQLFGAGREKRIYAIPPYTQVK